MRSPALTSSILVCATALLLFTGCGRSHRHSEESFDDSQPDPALSGDALTLSKVGGDISVDDAPNGANLHTVGGNIEVNKVEKVLQADTVGGNISIHTANVSALTAKSVGGNIDISSAQALQLKVTTVGGNITAQTLGDGSIYLKSTGGNIDLTIPKTVSAQIDIRLDYNGLTDANHTITDNLGLQQQKTSTWELWHLTHRYHITAEGTVGSGANRIVIRTVGSDVTVNSQ